MDNTKDKEKLNGFTCKLCSKTFTSKSCYEMHVISMHSDSKKRYECDICGKSFAWPSGRWQHKRKHFQRKSHKCMFCTKSFAKRRMLKVHLHSHDEYTPYSCGKCNRRFANLQKFQNHMQTSLCAKPSCQISEETPEKSEILRQSVGYKRGNCIYRNTCNSSLEENMKNEFRDISLTESQHSDKGVKGNDTEVKADTRSLHSEPFYRNEHMPLHNKTWTCGNCNRTFTLRRSYLMHRDSCSNEDHQCLICHVTIPQLMSIGHRASLDHTHVMTLLREPSAERSLSLPKCMIEVKKETKESIAELMKKIKQNSPKELN